MPYPRIVPYPAVVPVPPPAPPATPPATRRPKFTTPFKSTAALLRPPPSKQIHLTLSPSLSSSSRTSTRAPIAPVKRLKLPFKSPAFRPPALSPSNHHHAPASPAIELSNLERRVQVLRQARKYQKADELGEQGKDSETELRALCQRWKDHGRAAAELLWEHAWSFAPADAPASFGLGSFASGNSGGGGWSTSWGFADDQPSFESSTGFSSLWGFKNADPAPTADELAAQLNDRVASSGMTRKEVLAAVVAESDDLPTIEELTSKGGDWYRPLPSSAPKRKAIFLEENYSNDEAEDLLMKALDEASCLRRQTDFGNTPSQAELDPFQRKYKSDDDGDRPPVKPKDDQWNVGCLMRMVGVNPDLFGWDGEEELFVD